MFVVTEPAMATASRFLRKFPRFLKLSPTFLRSNGLRYSSNLVQDSMESLDSFWRIRSRIRHVSFTTRSFSAQGPASVDYRYFNPHLISLTVYDCVCLVKKIEQTRRRNSSVLQEDEFHKLANFTINNLLEKIEDYGDNVQIDGFDIDYGNEVLTLKLGSLGTYVLNKQTPNRQIWMSSPVSGPSRFDWDGDANAWIYRRTEAKLHKLLEEELENLCGEPIQLS